MIKEEEGVLRAVNEEASGSHDKYRETCSENADYKTSSAALNDGEATCHVM